MWNILAKIFDGGVSAVVDSATGIVRTIWGDRSAKDAAIAGEQHDVLTQFAAEFVARQQRSLWDSFVDGLNRLPRPALVIGVHATFFWAAWDPISFVECMRALETVPDALWVVWLTIVAFYFGGRIIEQAPKTWKVEPRALDLAKEIAKERTAKQVAIVEERKADVINAAADAVVKEQKETKQPSGTRGVRNNNPGNIEGRYFGAIGNDGRFAIYASPDDGIRAIETQLTRYYEGKTTGKPLCTVRDMISTWAPRNENDTGAYIAHVAKDVGVAPDAVLNWGNAETRCRAIKAIIDHENGPGHPYTLSSIRTAISAKA